MRIEYVPILGILIGLWRAVRIISLEQKGVIPISDGNDYIFSILSISLIITLVFCQSIMVALNQYKPF